MNRLGIQGFETILRGGILPRSEVLLLTPEGPERYLLGAHWVQEGVQRGERMLLVLSGESPEVFRDRLGRMGMDATVFASGLLMVVDWHTCWTRSGAGGEEGAYTVRASRGIEDLVAAIDGALSALPPGGNSRAWVDLLPRAFEAFEEEAVADLVRSVRARLGQQGFTTVYVADRATPEARLAPLATVFHAVLDTRYEDLETLGLAVLRLGGVRLSPRYRRIRLREDAAYVEGMPAMRAFSCPICDALVPLDAARCPNCKTPRSEMAVRARAGLMDYVESLRRPKEPEPERGRVSPPPSREPRPAGLTNGVRAPVNGRSAGRVNGVAPGRVNGLAPAGRTNGLPTPPGRTNGLVNGLHRARAGITNGLTNGSGFTNGLGGRRAPHEALRARWKLYAVPFLAASLLVTPLLLQETPRPPVFVVDGNFREWDGVKGYWQDPPQGTNPAVALTGYIFVRDNGALRLFANVSGTWFDDPDSVDTLYVFLDGDSKPETGYRVHGLGAEFMVSVEGSGRSVTGTSLRTFSGIDPFNWTAWQSSGSVSAAVAGRDLEMSIPWDERAENPLLLLMAEDSKGGRSFSAVVFGVELGAVRVRVSSKATVVSRGTPEVLALEFEAFGGTVKVSDLDIRVTNGTAVRPARLPLTLNEKDPEPVTVRIETGAPSGSLISAELRGVMADRPVLIEGSPVRAYVEVPPSGKAVDGWFGDWGPELLNDTDPVPVEPDRDLDHYAANRTGADLFLYADVRGQLLEGSPTPVRRARPSAEREQPTTVHAPPARFVGEDVFRAYVDVDRRVAEGVPLLGLRGADLLLEVRGIYGRVTRQTTFEWRDGWRPLSVRPAFANDERRLEASLRVPAGGPIDVAFETSGWAGPADSTQASGTRGVRSDGEGLLVWEGRFTVTFSPAGRVELAAGGARLAWILPPPIPAAHGFVPRQTAWTIAPTPVGVQYSGPGVEVRYVVRDAGLKEEFVFLQRPGALSELTFPFELGGETTAWVEEGQPVGVYAGSRRVFEVATPVAVDRAGTRRPLPLDTNLEKGMLRIPIPKDLLAVSTYPLVVDPVVNYTLENDGPSNDPGENLGWSVAVGDFNGDGYADTLTGAPSNNLGGSLHGYGYIYYGPFTANDTTPDVWINGTTSAGRFGYAVAAGKFNNDTFWDALVARLSIGAMTGNVSVYFGSATWSGLETTPDVSFTPPANPKNFGWAVAAGNLDNAGFDDVLISEPGRDNNDDGLADGVAYAYLSPFGGVESTADFTLLPSTNAGGQLGRSLAVGKIDSDAFADVVAGEPLVTSSSGRVQFYKGISFASGSGSRSPNATLNAQASGEQFGTSVSVGRINGDAYADVAVGAPTKSVNAGAAYVFLANANGTGLTTGAIPAATLASQSSAERFGTSVLVVDFDDDGTAGTFVGAPFASEGGANRGRAYWFDDPVADQAVDATLSGTQNQERLGQSLAGGRFGNDARTIVSVGAYLWDDGTEADSGRVVVASISELPHILVMASIVLPIAIARLYGRPRRSRRPLRSRLLAHSQMWG